MALLTLSDDWDEHHGGAFWSSNNVWNRGSLVNGVDYSQRIDLETLTFPAGATLSWSWPVQAELNVYAYPEIVLGWKPWNEYGSLAYNATINDLKSFTIDYDLSISGATQGFNIAFSLWLTDRPAGAADAIVTEVMIWVHPGGFNPAGGPVGRYDGSDFDAAVWSSPGHGDGGDYHWGYVALRADADDLKGTLDLKDILSDLRASGLVSGNSYVSGYELGAEIVGGAGSFHIDALSQRFEAFAITAGADVIIGDAHDEFIDGRQGNDQVCGLGGADTLIGGAGNDTLDGGANPTTQGDVLIGGSGDDTYVVDSGLDLVDEGSYFPVFGFGGVDTIVSTADFYWDVASVGEVIRVSEAVVDAGKDGVTVIGGVFDNTLIGHSGTDVLFGRGGSDTYRAGDGIDLLSLSTLDVVDAAGYVANGINTVVVEQRSSGPSSYDFVYAFESGHDRLDVSDYGFASQAAAFATGVDDGAGNSYFILGDGFDYLYMVGLELADLRAGDFVV